MISGRGWLHNMRYDIISGRVFDCHLQHIRRLQLVRGGVFTGKLWMNKSLHNHDIIHLLPINGLCT